MTDYSIEFLMCAFMSANIISMKTAKTDLHTGKHYDEVLIDKRLNKIVYENKTVELSKEAIKKVLEEEFRYGANLFNAEGKKLTFNDMWELALQNGCSAKSMLKVAIW